MKDRIVAALLLVFAGMWRAADAQNAPPFPDVLPDFYYPGGKAASTVALPDGSTLVGGYWSRGTAVVRLAPDGSVDRSYAKGGVAELVAWGSPSAYGPYLATLPDGSTVVAWTAKDLSSMPGCDYTYADCNLHTIVLRLDANGRQDTGFNGYGRLALRIGGPTPGPHEDGLKHYVGSIEPLADGAVLLHTPVGILARVLPDGRLDTTTGYPAHEHDFIAAVAYYHRGLDQYFVTSDIGEIAGLDRGWGSGLPLGGFHVYPAGWSAIPTVPVCRFYGLPAAGLDSHVLSANAEECASLEASQEHNGWILESREAFRVELPDALSGTCPPERQPVYRLWNGREDSGHLLTASLAWREYLLGQGYVSEGWGPLGVAMCSAPW